MDAGALEIRVRLVGPHSSQQLVDAIVRCALDEFGEVGWKAGNPESALTAARPARSRPRTCTCSTRHTRSEARSVRRGLMIGRFHERCDEKAARNPAFEVSHAPVPMVAVRSMAIHDVLFLGERREWFEEYVNRFGSRYQTSRSGIDPLLTTLYERALRRHGREG